MMWCSRCKKEIMLNGMMADGNGGVMCYWHTAKDVKVRQQAIDVAVRRVWDSCRTDGARRLAMKQMAELGCTSFGASWEYVVDSVRTKFHRITRGQTV